MADEEEFDGDVEFLSEVLYDEAGDITTDKTKAVSGQVTVRMPNGEVMHTRLVSDKAPKK